MFVLKFLLRLVFEQEFQQFAAFVFGRPSISSVISSLT